MMIKDVAIQKNDPGVCDFIDKSQDRIRLLCGTHFKPESEPSGDELALGITQKRGINTLLILQEDGTYVDTAKESGAGVGGWAWDTKTEGFDLNGTIDIYITNGSWTAANVSPSNMYFQNDGRGSFADLTTETGLQEFLMIPSVAASDLDKDGDLDLIGQAVNGPISTMRNNSQSSSRYGFTFSDEIGNRFCIGCKIVIHQSDGRKQMRELQSGGGFISYDSPKIYFGMGKDVTIEKVEVFWSTGQSSVLEDGFEAGQMYTIARTSGKE